MAVNNDVQTNAVGFDKCSRLQSILVVILGKPAETPQIITETLRKVKPQTHAGVCYNLPVIVTRVGLILSEIKTTEGVGGFAV